jgi:hypothetical protein
MRITYVDIPTEAQHAGRRRNSPERLPYPYLRRAYEQIFFQLLDTETSALRSDDVVFDQPMRAFNDVLQAARWTWRAWFAAERRYAPELAQKADTIQHQAEFTERLVAVRKGWMETDD